MKKDDATLLLYAYLMATVIGAYVFWQVFETVGVQTGWSERFYAWYGNGTLGISVLLGALLIFLLSRDSERHQFYLSAVGELRKVSWPSWNDTKKMTIIVCVVVGIFGVILSVFDVIWAKLLNLMLV